MASPPTSPFATSIEKTNGVKLWNLVTNGGAAALRILLNKSHSPQPLATWLGQHKQTLSSLKHRVLKDDQWRKLFPSDGTQPDCESFDITLLVILLINICGLSPPNTGWNEKPPRSDRSTEANIARIRYFRNLLSHAPSTGVTTQNFNSYWEEIADALVALGLDQNEIDALKKEKELEKLARFDFVGDINHHLGKLTDGTREWVFNEVENWLDDSSSLHRAMLITAAAGMGKSVASAAICKRMQRADRVIGCHFCQHSFDLYRDPKRMLQSLAYQLSSKLPEYKAALVEQLSSDRSKDLEHMRVSDLFVWLFEPLFAVADPGRNVLVIIDGLDESELDERNELLDVIANQLSKLPLWIRFLITARPEKNISDKLRNLKIFKLQQEDERNRDDIKTFFEKKLNSGVTNPDSHSATVQELVHLSDGSMLFAYFLIQMIQNNTSPGSPEELRRQFPQGISSVYQSYFERMETRLKEELKDNYGNFLTDLLSALTVSEEPLHKDFIVDILLQNSNTSESDPLCDQRKLKGVIDCISSLFILRDDHVHMFHKSIKDWLTDPSNGFFFVKEKKGHKILFKLCAKVLEIEKRRREHHAESPTQAMKKYALRHGVKHMLEALETGSAQMEELVHGYVTDLELIYAKLCTEDTDVLKDLVLVQEHPNSRELSNEIDNTIESLLLQFKKNPKLLRDNPEMIFQNLLNEGGSALYQQVSDTLLRSHPEIPYMELLDKNGHQGPVVGRFFCSDKVVCFDVSPDEKLLVSECRDGKTSLWSLETGKRLWEKALLKSIKSYNEVPLGSAFRQTCEDNETGKRTLSFYRSTVFHPDGCSILPGNLAKVYSLDGKTKSLFPGSKCHFNVRYFSGNKTRMLTDCPENAHQVVMWNTKNGEEIKRFESEETIASFAFSQDGNRVAICNTSGSLWLRAVEDPSWKKAPQNISGEGNPCGLLHFTEAGTLVCGSIQHELSDHRDKYKLSVPAFQSQSSCVFLWPWESVDSVDRLKVVCKTSHFVSADLQIGFCLMLLRDLAVVGSPTVNYLTMLDISRPLQDEEMPRTAQAAFSTVNDSTRLYTTIALCNHAEGMKTDESRLVTFTMRDANNAREVKQEKHFQHSSRRVENGILTVTVTYNGETGVLLQTDSKTLEVWNCDLSQGLNSITMMGEIERLIPVSQDLVGCVLCTPKFSSEGQQELTIALFDVSAWKVVFERNLSGKPELKSIACSLQRGVVFCAENDARKREMFFYRGEANVPIWSEDDIYQGGCNWRHPHCVFSPQGDVVVTWNTLNDGYGLHALNAKTGMRKHVFLENCYDIADCRFLNDGETMVCYRYESNVRLFSVTSGEVLAVLDIGERPTCIGCSPGEPRIAVGLRFGNVIVIRAHVPKLRRANHKQRKVSKCLYDKCQWVIAYMVLVFLIDSFERFFIFVLKGIDFVLPYSR